MHTDPVEAEVERGRRWCAPRLRQLRLEATEVKLPYFSEYTVPSSKQYGPS